MPKSEEERKGTALAWHCRMLTQRWRGQTAGQEGRRHRQSRVTTILQLLLVDGRKIGHQLGQRTGISWCLQKNAAVVCGAVASHWRGDGLEYGENELPEGNDLDKTGGSEFYHRPMKDNRSKRHALGTETMTGIA